MGMFLVNKGMSPDSCILSLIAEMAELADAQRSGRCGLTLMGVQLPLSAYSYCKVKHESCLAKQNILLRPRQDKLGRATKE